MIKVDSRQIFDFLKELLLLSGLNDFCSNHTAKGVVEASLRGVDSHGVQLIPHYIDALKSGRINKNPDFSFIDRTKTSSILDADHSIGFSAGIKAIDNAINKAEKYGVGAVSVKNSTHGGMMAYYTIRAAKKGMFALAMTNTTPRLIPPNGRKAFLGTNPLSYAVPLLNEDPLCYDAATTQITGNKVKLYRRLGKKLPENLAADKDGNPTTNPDIAENLFAFGGYKGFGISMLVDILCGALTGMPNSENVSEMYGGSIDHKRYLGQFFLVFKISSFREIEQFTKDLQDEVDRLRKLPNRGNKIVAPGDLEKNKYKKRIIDGIPVDKKLYETFNQLAQKANLERLKHN